MGECDEESGDEVVKVRQHGMKGEREVSGKGRDEVDETWVVGMSGRVLFVREAHDLVARVLSREAISTTL
jgi:hypothetical protein